MQRLADLDMPMVWWEVPYRRGAAGPEAVAFVAGQLDRVRRAVGDLVGRRVSDDMLSEIIGKANRIRALLRRIRDLAYGSIPVPFPALETQIVEMLAIHFCSDLEECGHVLEHVASTLERRAAAGQGVLNPEACRVVWVNPVADLRVMNLFEDMGGALAGSEYLFRHALVPIPEDCPPLIALAKTALCDPMTGPAEDRAALVVQEAVRYRAEGILVSSIPGASHSATEGLVIRRRAARDLDIPVCEITVPPMADSSIGQLATRFEGFFEIIRDRRRHA